MMDLRWGLREESQDNHTVIEFCMQEIENCAKMSLGPSFVVCLLLRILPHYTVLCLCVSVTCQWPVILAKLTFGTWTVVKSCGSRGHPFHPPSLMIVTYLSRVMMSSVGHN